MPYPQRPTDLFVVNGWYLEMPGLISPHFETLEGIQKEGGSITMVDAGSNKKYHFSDQLIDFGELSLSRVYQGTVDDVTLEAIVDRMISEGLKLPVTAIKMHNKKEAFRLVFEGFRIRSKRFPTFDVNGGEKFSVGYSGTCDDWRIVR